MKDEELKFCDLWNRDVVPSRWILALGILLLTVMPFVRNNFLNDF